MAEVAEWACPACTSYDSSSDPSAENQSDESEASDEQLPEWPASAVLFGDGKRKKTETQRYGFGVWRGEGV